MHVVVKIGFTVTHTVYIYNIAILAYSSIGFIVTVVVESSFSCGMYVSNMCLCDIVVVKCPFSCNFLYTYLYTH